MDILAIVKRKLTTPQADDVLQDYIAETEMAIKNYCNIEEVPEQLKFTWANMSFDLIMGTQASAADDAPTGDVKSLQVGDTKIDFGAKAHNINLDTITLNYKDQLTRYRKVKW